ncbi:primosomal protein N' [Acidicapsa dinghuensis]|uniref:Replication restart protein PriA n=1 Tax=Acidicapsa dinghuensis TaxID=2218256 RepID=A0ABW1EN84_9BACT|nr:primosomal protein N' [Acidicapsa dinghuensis]
MPSFCEVALPVPLDRTFTYAVGDGVSPQRGARVIVPFRNEKLIGVVIEAHERVPEEFDAKPVETLIDEEPILSARLMELGEWMAQYYLAPIGEVLRGMLPLTAEVRRTVYYRITDVGRDALAKNHDGDDEGSTRRRKQTDDDSRDAEWKVLERLADGEAVKLSTLRTATAVSLPLLAGMARKRWIARETSAMERDARRIERHAVLVVDARLPALTAKQQAILAELAACGNEMPLQALREKGMSASSLQTLVRRGLVRIEERQAAFRMSGLGAGKIGHLLNEAQMEALASIATVRSFEPFLLYGVTGSGKTAVYLAAMQRVLDEGKGAILLVPEIGLTPAAAAQLDATFGQRVALLHSALTPAERSEQWHRIRRGDAPIVVGTRSAVFAPVPNLGLILVDEEHDNSYKQEESPRYNARDVAVMRGKLEDVPVVLGSATPSLETWQNAQAGKYRRLAMTERVNHRPLPRVELVDMRMEFQQTGKEQLFSRRLIEETQAALDRGEQAMILLNRRGYSFVCMCRSCGEKLECVNCAISLTHHKSSHSLDDVAVAGQRLECHYCGYRRSVPKVCPKCESEHLYYLGAGSQQGEERLQEIFPAARIGRMDRDTVRGRSDMERVLARLHSGEINLLVGTQMIAKGHDVHGVTFVGVVGCDHALALPDFRAAERVFQLMTQVSGRAGRGELPGRVVLQTYYPEHYAVQAASEHDYDGFVTREIKYRRWMHYPPFGVLANLLVVSKRMEEAAGWSAELGKWFERIKPEGVRVLGPCTAPIARIKEIYRFHLILKAASRRALNTALRGAMAHAEEVGIPRRNVIADVDPLRLL